MVLAHVDDEDRHGEAGAQGDDAWCVKGEWDDDVAIPVVDDVHVEGEISSYRKNVVVAVVGLYTGVGGGVRDGDRRTGKLKLR